MSIILNAVIDENRSLVVSPSGGFSGENISDMLEIDIGPFADGGYDFFVLNFENFATKGKFTSNVIRTENDTPSYIDSGVIFCPVTAQMTASGRLRVQLEAHKSTEKGAMVRKSSVAELTFGDSIMGTGDMMGSDDPVFERLEELEDRLDEIDEQNFGESIDCIGKRVDILEDNAEITAADIADAKSRLTAVEDFKIVQTFEDFEKRISDLEEAPEGIASLPVASADTLGGVKVDNINSEISIDEKGKLGINYGNLNARFMSLLMVVALLYREGAVDIIVAENTESIWSWVIEKSLSILNGELEAVVFTVLESGQIQYYDENYSDAKADVAALVIYVLKLVDGTMTLTAYSESERRKLLTEGF